MPEPKGLRTQIIHSEWSRCQVVDVTVRDELCPHTESGGYHCEVPGEHTDHAFSRHTTTHVRLGNGYSCEAIEKHLGRTDA